MREKSDTWAKLGITHSTTMNYVVVMTIITMKITTITCSKRLIAANNKSV